MVGRDTREILNILLSTMRYCLEHVMENLGESRLPEVAVRAVVLVLQYGLTQ